jgi:hypothetical protein
MIVIFYCHLYQSSYEEEKLRVKLFRYRHTGAKQERKYSSYSFLTSALNGGEWSASRPGRALPAGNDSRSHWIEGWVGLRAGLTQGLKERSFVSAGDRTPVVHSVVRHYTKWATNRYSNRYLPLLRQFFLVQNIINMFVNILFGQGPSEFDHYMAIFPTFQWHPQQQSS